MTVLKCYSNEICFTYVHDCYRNNDGVMSCTMDERCERVITSLLTLDVITLVKASNISRHFSSNASLISKPLFFLISNGTIVEKSGFFSADAFG